MEWYFEKLFFEIFDIYNAMPKKQKGILGKTKKIRAKACLTKWILLFKHDFQKPMKKKIENPKKLNKFVTKFKIFRKFLSLIKKILKFQIFPIFHRLNLMKTNSLS